MARQIIINTTPQETRVVALENARLVNFQTERRHERGLVGSIFKGRVTRVLPGMQAAFVDIGLEKAAFLPAADYLREDDTPRFRPRDTHPADSASPETEPAPAGTDEEVHPPEPPLPPLEERLQEGQEIIVQIGKEPIGNKGARVTSLVSLPGRLVVYLPIGDHVGISRRIGDEEERARIEDAVNSGPPRAGGIIVRTACEGVAEDEIQIDLAMLHNLWKSITDAANHSLAPALLHQDLDVSLRTIRDMRVMEISKIVVDQPDAFERIGKFVGTVMPQAPPRVELYEHTDPIFERYGIESQIAKALEPRVWLRSGGYIIIDTTEALTSIDVNTGRFIGKKDQRHTALKVNLEAAQAVAEQLRLRDIGGVIVIDFIDLDLAEDRDAVLAALDEAMQLQRTRAEVHGFSELGLVEMTRHRKRENLRQRLCEPCPRCRGRGYVKAAATTAYETIRALRRAAMTTPTGETIAVSVHPDVSAFLAEYEPSALVDIETEFHVRISLHASTLGGPDEFALGGAETGPEDQAAAQSALAPTAKCD